MQNNDFCNKSRCEFLKFLIQLTFLVSLQEQICRKYFLKGFDNFLYHVLGLLYAITNYFTNKLTSTYYNALCQLRIYDYVSLCPVVCILYMTMSH